MHGTTGSNPYAFRRPTRQRKLSGQATTKLALIKSRASRALAQIDDIDRTSFADTNVKNLLTSIIDLCEEKDPNEL